MPRKLHEHVIHRYEPRNVNTLHEQENKNGGFNTRLAVSVTKATGTMWMAYFFMCLALLGFPFLVNLIGPFVAIYVVWFSQTFLQLVFLPILSVGQNVLGRKAELQSEEAYNTTMKSYHDIEQIILHLEKQDEELLKQSDMLLKLMQEKENVKKI